MRTTYMIDNETRELITKREWLEKYGEKIHAKAPMFFVKGKFDAYESPITGKIITSARQRAAEMKEHGCVDYEPSLKDEIDRNVRNEELALDKHVDDTVDYEIANMPAQKREKLFEELRAGADINVERHNPDET